MKWRELTAAVAALLALSGCASLGLEQSADTSAITATLKGFTDRGDLVGVSALVTKDGKEFYYSAFGHADREAHKPMARDTIVQIYSMTKPVTGVALMRLWEEGKFRLDDPVAKYIPELAGVKVYAGTDASGAPILVAPDRPMLIQDMVRHTAGLGYGGGSSIPAIAKKEEATDLRTPSITLDELARRLATIPLEYQPGEKWRYSYAVDVQALLVQRLSGMPFDQYVQRTILDPLRMKDTSFYLPPEKRERLAAMYRWTGPQHFDREPDETAFNFATHHWPMTPGGHGLVSTLDDYTRFARMLLNGGELDGVRILKPSTVRLMTTSQLDPAITDRSWLVSKGRVGFGVDLAVRVDPPASSQEAAGAVGEYFWDGMAYTLFWVDPKNALTAVFFTQYQTFGKVEAHKAFRDAVYGIVDPAALPPKQP